MRGLFMAAAAVGFAMGAFGVCIESAVLGVTGAVIGCVGFIAVLLVP